MKEEKTCNNDFIKYKDDVLDYTLVAHQQFTKHNTFLLALYGLGLGVIDIENKSISSGICYLIAAISFGMYMLTKFYFPKKKVKVVLACNIYLFVFLLLLRVLYYWHPSQIANTLLLCSMVTTSLTNMTPKKYTAVLMSVSLIHMAFHFVVLPYKDIVELIGYWLNDVLVFVFMIGINRLFTKMKYAQFKQEKHLRNESYRDPLTKLYNRRYVERYVDLHLEENDNCAVILIDLDNFKSVNDILGHETGDELLCNVSNILKHSFRKTDCAARIGGDEFLILMPDVEDINPIVHKVSGILNKFPIIYEKDKQEIQVSASIGIAFYRAGDGCEYEDIYRKADEYMYKAKNKGKGIAVMENLDGNEDMVIG